MFENIIQTSIFVRILIFAFASILTINLVVAVINLGLSVYMKAKGIK
jgi:hypothetical protein